MVACTNHIADRRDHDRAIRRGGGRIAISIDRHDAESRYGMEPSHELTAERLFERRWAGLQNEGNDATRKEVTDKLKIWKADPDLNGVRDPGALIKLPEAERKVW